MSENENCHVDPVDKPLDKEALHSAMAAYLAVNGMECKNCAARVRKRLLSLEGVLLSGIQLEQDISTAAFDPQRVMVEDLTRAVTQFGNDGHHHYYANLIKEVPAAQALR